MNRNQNTGVLESFEIIPKDDFYWNVELIQNIRPKLIKKCFNKNNQVKKAFRDLSKNPSLDTLLSPIEQELRLNSDWANNIVNWPIYNQVPTNMCVGFSVGSGLFEFMYNKHLHAPEINITSTKSFNLEFSVSPRFAYMVAKKYAGKKNGLPWSDLEPTYIYTAIKGVIKWGLISNEAFPFKLKTAFLGTSETYSFENKLQRKTFEQFESIHWLVKEYQSKRADFWVEAYPLIINHLLDEGPLVLMLSIDRNWIELKDTETPYLIDFDQQFQKSTHSVLLTGVTFQDGQWWFVVRNSFGENWGKEGFGWLSESYFRSSLKEAYGIKLKSNFPAFEPQPELPFEIFTDGIQLKLAVWVPPNRYLAPNVRTTRIGTRNRFHITIDFEIDSNEKTMQQIFMIDPKIEVSSTIVFQLFINSPNRQFKSDLINYILQ